MSEMVRKFSGKLFQQLSAEADAGNMICSPVSVSTVLAMALAGARGDTANEIRQACGFDQDDQETFKYFKGLSEMLKADKDGCKLIMANKMFLDSKYVLAPDFSQINKEFFLAEPETCKFEKNPAGAEKKINGFVKKATNFKIKELVKSDDFDRYTALVLVNAIYFKGTWQSPFPKASTDENGESSVTSERRVKVAMMHTSGHHYHTYCDTIKAEFLEMTYEGGKMAMIFVLPFEETPISDVESQLKDYSWGRFYEECSLDKFEDVAIPRFKIESSFDFKKPLIDLGIKDAFCQEKADFSGMLASRQDLYISKIVQKAFVEINEEGAEGAAATVAMMSVPRGLVIERPRYFKCDRPFLFVILSKDIAEEASARNIVPLFMGKVNNPSQK